MCVAQAFLIHKVQRPVRSRGILLRGSFEPTDLLACQAIIPMATTGRGARATKPDVGAGSVYMTPRPHPMPSAPPTIAFITPEALTGLDCVTLSP